MSQQVEFLKNVIASVRAGDDGALALLRQICRAAADKAPSHDLLTMGECLYHIGIEATRSELRRN